MGDQNRSIHEVTRRQFLSSVAATATAISMLPLASSCNSTTTPSAKAGAVPNSNYNGVQVGVITYSFRGLEAGIEAVIKAAAESGCSSIELMSNGIEDWCGAPVAPPRQMGPIPGVTPSVITNGLRTGRGSQRAPLTPEQQAAQDKYNNDIKAWRLNAPMEKFAELKKMFNDAGVDIHIVKWEPSRWSDEEIDYAFKSAKALGAKGVSEEWSLASAQKCGPIAEKYGMKMIYHNHGQWGENPDFEADVVKPALAVSSSVMFNFDMGHFEGSTGRHPNEIIDKYKDRIFSLHLKDKTGPDTTPANTNQVWGQGETKLEDVLLKVRDEKLPYYCDIELEYPIPVWSNSVREVRTCVNFARQILI